jgi:hypothetical protein
MNINDSIALGSYLLTLLMSSVKKVVIAEEEEKEEFKLEELELFISIIKKSLNDGKKNILVVVDLIFDAVDETKK